MMINAKLWRKISQAVSRAGSKRLWVFSVLFLVIATSLVLFASADNDTTEGSTGPEMQMGVGDITRDSNVYMGDISNGYAGNQLKWQVLDPDKDNAGNPGAMFMLSRGTVGEKDSKGKTQPFRYYDGWWNPIRKFSTNNFWHHSSMPKWCETFTNKVFTGPEKKAIRPVTKKETPSESVGPFKDKILVMEPDGHTSYWEYIQYDLLLWPDTIKEQKVFFPSYDEIKHDNSKASMPGAEHTKYWLRSPGEIYPYYQLLDLLHAFVAIHTSCAEHKDYGKNTSPAFEYEDVTRKCFARPVMNIEKGSVVFSNVAGAKEGMQLGEMKEMNQNREERTDWELTLEDPDRRDFDVDLVKVHTDGDHNHTAEVKVSGAKTGMCDYISAIAADGEDNILYYGRINKSIGETYTYQIPITWDVSETDIKLYVFNEWYEGKEKSSHISPLRAVNIQDPDKGIRVVNFDLNGHGSPQPEWQEVEEGEKATEPERPFALGYDFRGWFTEPETEIAWNFDDVVERSMTLYAGWEAHKYKITYDANGGGGEMPDQDRYYLDGEAIKECEFSPPGNDKKFIGWNTSPDGSGQYHYPGETDDLTYNDDTEITLYAQWSDELMVAYHLNGHGGPQPDSETTSADKGWKITRPEDPTDKAYTFDGWYTTPGCDQGDAWDFEKDALENNMTLFAKWSPHGYTVHFENNESSIDVDKFGPVNGEMEDQHRECGDNVPITNEFRPYSHLLHFLEWNTDPDGVGISYEDGYTGDLAERDGDEVTLYAIWRTEVYDIEFDPNGGSGDQMEKQERNWGEPKPLRKNTYTRDGYEFIGWNDKADGTGRFYEDETTEEIVTATTPVILYAQWVSEYTVHFDSNGGNGKMADELRSIGDGKSLPENRFTRDGREFAGWNTERDGSGDAYEDGFTGDLKVRGDEITLYAQWRTDYTIHYEPNGGTGNMPDQLRTFEDGESLTPNEFSREGYVFDCWNTEADGSGIEYADKAEGDLSGGARTITLYAQWKPETVYTITFDANGKNFEDGQPTHTRTTDIYGYLEEFEPAPQGGFYGWYSAPDGGVKVAEGARFTSDTTLYACWTRQNDDIDWDSFRYTGPFTVTYDPMGGTVDPTTKKTEPGWQNKNKVYISSHPTPVREHYGFEGWYTAPEGGTLAVPGTDDNASPPPAQYMSDTTLYAHWGPMEYTVRYNSNGGQGTMPDQHRTWGDEGRLAPNVFSRANYKFNGWNTDKDGLGEPYEDRHLGDITDKEETIVLYAQWKKEEYIVNFDLNGVDGQPKPASFLTGPENDYKAEKPAKDPEAEGYTFAGWYKEPECINEWDFEKDIVVEESTTLYAKWIGNPYTVKFDPGRGTIDDKLGPMKDQERIVGDGISLPECTYGPPPNSSGAVFKGWNTKMDGSGESFDDRSTEDVATGGTVTLYAQWTPTRIAVFDLNGHGTGAPAPQMRGEMHGYKVDKPLKDPTAKGYDFTGWYKEPECINKWDFENDVLEKAITTLYAGWDPIKYTVAFDANPPEGKTAEGQMDEVSRNYDDYEPLPPVGFSIKEPNGSDKAYTFTGWNTEADGSGDGFGDEDSQNITSTGGAKITLYAQWDMAQITTSNLPDGRQGEYYETMLTQMGLMEESSIQWSLAGDEKLPEGLSLDGETGIISGTTDQAGTFTFTVQVTGMNLMGDTETLAKNLSLDIIQKDPELLIIEFIEGMNGSWTKGSKNDLRFKTNGPFEMFSSIEVDGKQLKAGTDYTAAEGSTVIMLKAGYLEGLSEGSHIITAGYNDGQAPFTAFSIAARPDDEKKDDDPDRKVKPDIDPDNDDGRPDNDDGSPDNDDGGYDKDKDDRPAGADTGDGTDFVMLLMAALSMLASMVGVTMFVRKRAGEKRQ